MLHKWIATLFHKNDIKLSIIVSIYNVESYLERCLNSLKPLCSHNIEIILVDDGSTDNSPSIISNFIKDLHYANLKLITKQNGGLSSARNSGLEIVQGEYVTFVDGDDYISPQNLIELCNVLNQEVDVIITPPIVHYLSNKNLKKNDEIYFRLPSVGIKFSSEINPIAIPSVVWSKIYRVELIRKLNLQFPVNLLYEDNYWHWIFMKGLNSALFSETSFYNYVRRPESIMSKTFEKKEGYSIQRILILQKILTDCKNLTSEERSNLVQTFFNSALSDCSKIDYLQLFYLTQRTVRLMNDSELSPFLIDLKYGNLTLQIGKKTESSI